MKKIVYIASTICLLAGISFSASAKGLIIYGKGFQFEILKELPPHFKEGDLHLNFGIAYNQFSLYWVPLWNSGAPQYVLVTDDKKYAYELDDKDLEYINDEFGIDTSVAPGISFWNRIGGKLVAIIVLALLSLFVYSLISKKKASPKIVLPKSEPVPEPVSVQPTFPDFPPTISVAKRIRRKPVVRPARAGIRQKRKSGSGIRQKRK
ncbi:MAG: hypothetical protein LBN18_02130 [Dysgonamonadaceae bacterium]|jgi:hypothetical protein|nr:hypothetical protein [Dysgonamonadaceae bacterium]